MKVIFKKSMIDDKMLNIMTRRQCGGWFLWGAIHSDFLSGAFYERLEDEGIIELELSEVKE